MNHKSSSARVGGLDTLRAVAICLVLMTHYNGFVSHQQTFGWIGSVGWAGVDLFFVLSGYLIGNQITSSVSGGQSWSLRTFFSRRLLRTLPNYYAVLLIYLVFPGVLTGTSTAPAWQFLTFTQNFGLKYGETFTHSWSLCIEEQFYLVLPFAAIAVSKYARSVRAAWWLLGAAIATGIVLRGVAALVYGYDSFSAELYYSTFARFDELLCGVAVALLKNFHPAVYASLIRRGNALLIAGLLGAVGVLVALAAEFPSPHIATALGFSLLAGSFALLTLAALSPVSLLHRMRIPGAASLALWSYAIYLVHKPIFMLINPQLARRHIDAASVQVVALVLALAVAGGWLLFRLVETPFMRLRERWFPPPRGQHDRHSSGVDDRSAQGRRMGPMPRGGPGRLGPS